MNQFGVEEPDLNPIEHLWDELEQRLRARPSVQQHKCASGRMVKTSHKHTPKPCGKFTQKSYSSEGWADIILNPID